MTAPQLNVAVNGLNSISADNLNTMLQGCDNVSQLRGFVGVTGMQVYVRGYTTVNDGGQGWFYWNASATNITNPDDGGITNIVPNGASLGVWTRISTKDTNVIPTSAAGVNAIVLEPLSNTPTIASYQNYQLFSFVAPASSTGSVTVQYASLPALPLYGPNLSQIGAGGISAGQFLLIAYNSALNAGAGGFVIVSSQPTSGSVTATTIVTPQGRLTLISGSPVMTTEATAQTTVYYTPYVGNQIPIYNGTAFSNSTFSEITLPLDNNSGHTGYQQSGNLYDLFIFNNSGTVTLGTGPAWSTGTTRGTGAGTTQIQLLNGIWTNANSITLRIGSASGNTATVAANQATYVGTLYATANGQTGVQFKPSATSGGTANILGLYNAYNRIIASSSSRDTNASWTYATATWRAADNNNNNRISFVDGLQQSEIDAYYCVPASASGGQAAYIGLNINSTSTQPNITGTSAVASQPSVCVVETFSAVLGFNYVQAVEFSTGATSTFYGFLNSNPLQELRIKIAI